MEKPHQPPPGTYNINVNINFPRIEEIITLLRQVLTKEDSILATLADVQSEVAAEKTVVDSVVALITSLAAQVAALQPNQAAIDQLATDIKAQADSLAAAVTANTPAA